MLISIFIEWWLLVVKDILHVCFSSRALFNLWQIRSMSIIDYLFSCFLVLHLLVSILLSRVTWQFGLEFSEVVGVWREDVATWKFRISYVVGIAVNICVFFLNSWRKPTVLSVFAYFLKRTRMLRNRLAYWTSGVSNEVVTAHGHSIWVHWSGIGNDRRLSDKAIIFVGIIKGKGIHIVHLKRIVRYKFNKSVVDLALQLLRH